MADLLFLPISLTSLVGIAYFFSTSRSDVNWRLVGVGFVAQIIVALAVLKTLIGASLLHGLAEGFVGFISYAQEGSKFMLGSLLDVEKNGFILAIQVLPPLIFISAVTSVLYYLGTMPLIVGGIAKLLSRTMGISGAEALAVAANIFVGQTEAPLAIKPYIAKMTESELFTLMVGGMASVAGNILAAYVGVLAGEDKLQQVYYAKHMLAASFMSAPAAIIMAKVLIPETETPITGENAKVQTESEASNVLEAASIGATEGMNLAINVAAMLFAFIALVALVNAPLEWFGRVSGLEESMGHVLSLSFLMGYFFAPLAWLTGVPWDDAILVGGLFGEKIVFNEFVAYLSLADIKESISPKAALIATYALCGFANFGSIAVQIGGISAIAPSRRADLARLGVKSIAAGMLATMMTGAIAGALGGLHF